MARSTGFNALCKKSLLSPKSNNKSFATREKTTENIFCPQFAQSVGICLGYLTGDYIFQAGGYRCHQNLEHYSALHAMI